MAETAKHNYDESKIKTLSSLEHIRSRTGMYIGRLGTGAHYDDGIYVLLKEVLDNAVDEYIMGFGREVRLEIAGPRVRVRDFGRGIPLGKVVEGVSTINTGAKYNDDVFQFSVGLNGVGTKAVNALSRLFVVRRHREGRFVEAVFQRGRLKKQTEGRTDEPDGAYVEFEPDPNIFKEFEYRPGHVERRLRYYSYLNTGLHYEKVILAADANVDGLHIRNLLITYFFRFFEQLVHDGHLYVLETPLFRVRNKERTLYCYSEAGRDAAVKELGGQPEITRFKGLGEISPKEFARFIGPDMRLSRVEYAPKPEATPILDFYMGKNTPQRCDYIMKRLVVPVEE